MVDHWYKSKIYLQTDIVFSLIQHAVFGSSLICHLEQKFFPYISTLQWLHCNVFVVRVFRDEAETIKVLKKLTNEKNKYATDISI
jgi:hypothetical protein